MTPQMKEILDSYLELGPLTVESLTPENARNQPEFKEAAFSVLQSHPVLRGVKGIIEPVDKIYHILIPTPEGELEARVYNPAPGEKLPLILYFHGGGWVLSSLNSYDFSCRALANASKCIIVSVAYRQAPEHAFPSAHNDAFDSYKWLVSNAESVHGDASKIAVAGEGAGGNLAVSISLRCIEDNFKLPLHQLLIYPILNDNMDTFSYKEHQKTKPLNSEVMKWYFRNYFKGEIPYSAAKNIFPLKSKSLHKLPPTTVISAELDPLLTEAENFVKEMQKLNNIIIHRTYLGVTHDFFGFSSILKEASDAVEFAAQDVRKSFFKDL